MIVKVDKNTFTQKCGHCGEIYSHRYSDFLITAKMVTLRPCAKCNSLEILCNNNGNDSHGILVSRVFANIASAQE